MSNKEKAAVIVAIADKLAELNKLLAKGLRMQFSQTKEGLLQAKVLP